MYDVDPSRSSMPKLGISVKAQDGAEVDINQLDLASLMAYLGVEKYDQNPNKVIGLLCTLMSHDSPWNGMFSERDDLPFEPPQHDSPRRDLMSGGSYEWSRHLAYALEDFDGVDGAVAKMATVELEKRGFVRQQIACARQHILAAYDIIKEESRCKP